MVEIGKLKKVTALICIGIIATSTTFTILIGFSQVYGTNPFFDDDTNYDFKVVSEIVNVSIRKDGGIDIEYWIEFHAYYYSIPIVDIGFPNLYYDLSSVEADLDGVPISDIRRSEYLMIGVEIHLGSNTIAAYHNGLLHVKARNPIMVFRDDFQPFTMASVEFSPTWFDPYICRGVDYLEVNMIFPEGFTDGNAVRWHYYEPYYTLTSTELMYTWNWSNINPEQYIVGVSLPISAVGTVYDSWLFGLFSPIQKIVFIVLILVLTGIALGVTYKYYKKYRKNAKFKYLKPSGKIDCLGIKRGMTVPEAAILIGVRLDRVVSLIIFGLIRKKVLDITSVDPPRFTRKEKIQGLHKYEKEFTDKCLIPVPKRENEFSVKERALKSLMVNLIKDVNKKMEGYSRKDTQLYYKRIMNKAFDEIKESGTKGFDEKKLSENFEWLLLDPDEKLINHEFIDRGVFVPYWYYHYHYYYMYRRPYVPLGRPSLHRAPIRINGFQFAHNVVKNLETFSNSVVKNLSVFSNSVLNTLFPPATSGGMSGRSYSGGGCACACACACAGCACACAGGGR